MVAPELFALPIELVSPTSRRRDRIDKSALCAAAGIPHFMHVEVDRPNELGTVSLLELHEDRYVHAWTAGSGELFEVDTPFEMSLDPAVLLEP